MTGLHPPRTMDLRLLLDRQRLGPIQIAVVMLCLAAMLIDGYDLFMLGMALPKVAGAFGAAPGQVTGIVVAQSIGLALGTYAMGPFSDRFGRKWPLVGSVFAFAVLTLLTTQVMSLTQFAFVRFLSGMCFAGVIPNAVALTNEMTPLRHRSGFVALIFCGYAGGTSIGSFVNGHMLATHGWQAIFWLGGALGLVLVVPLALCLPESLPFRIRRDPRDPAAARLMARMFPDLRLGPGDVIVPGEDAYRKPSRSAVGDLFSRDRLSLTLLLWALFALGFIGTTTLAGWSATILNIGAGLPIQTVGTLIGLFALVGLLGTATSGFIMRRIGTLATLTGFYGIAIVALLGLAMSDYRGWSAYLFMAVCGLGFNGGQGALNAFASLAYPTRMRATGVGWAFGSGRLGAIVGPIIGGRLIAAGYGPGSFFMALTLPLILIVLLVPATVAAHGRAMAKSE